jgi:hypothetical protein
VRPAAPGARSGADRQPLGHNYVGTEHILLALLELDDGDGVLAGLGIGKAATEAAITAALAAIVAVRDGPDTQETG